MGLTDGLVLRAPTSHDATAIAKIDADCLATGHATLREALPSKAHPSPHDWASFSSAFAEGRGLSLVAGAAGAIAGWAEVAPTSARAVYRGVGKVSVDVAARSRGAGVGRALVGR